MLGTALALLALAGTAAADPRIVYEGSHAFGTDAGAVRWAEGPVFVVCSSSCPQSGGLAPSRLRILLEHLGRIPSVPPPAEAAEAGSGQGTRVPEELRVYFDFDRAVLRPEAVQSVEQFLRRLDLRAFGFEVLGYACPTGPEEYNRRLSLRRARAAAACLERLGGRVLRVEGRGEVVFDPQRFWKSRCAVIKAKPLKEVLHGGEVR